MPRCPACKIQLDRVTYENVPLYNCGGCGGYMLNELKLDRICSIREVNMPEPVRQKMMDIADAHNRSEKLWCFSCGVEMNKTQFKFWNDIEIDHCPKCQHIWLDKGELEKCQIYWEYMQDQGDAHPHADVMERRALLEAQLAERKHDLQDRMDEMSSARHGRFGWGGFGIFDLLFQITRR